jgi:hypothetical protein
MTGKQTTLSFAPGEDLSFTSSPQRLSPRGSSSTLRTKPIRKAYVDKQKQADPNDCNASGGESVIDSDEGSDGPKLVLAAGTTTGAQDGDEDEGMEVDSGVSLGGEEEDGEVQPYSAIRNKSASRRLILDSDDEAETLTAQVSTRLTLFEGKRGS